MISQTLDIAISMVCVFLLASILLSSLYEAYASMWNQRGKLLKQSLQKLYQDISGQNLLAMTYSHPEIHLLKDGNKLPSYISSSAFANATISSIISNYKTKVLAIKYNEGKATIEGQLPADYNDLLKEAISSLEPSHLKTILLSNDAFHDDKKQYHERIGGKLENWFEELQQRNTGWYKRLSKVRLFWVGLAFCVMFNFNPIDIYLNIKENTKLQAFAFEYSKKLVASDSFDVSKYNSEQLLDTLNKFKDLGLPFGYAISAKSDSMIVNKEFKDLLFGNSGQFYKELWSYNFKWHTIIGWLLGALLLMINSSTWFELLLKLVNIRGAGMKPESKSTNNK
jgi:hypothetical protein